MPQRERRLTDKIAAAILDAFGGAGLFSALYVLALLVPGIAITTRRSHDTGHSGWWQLTYFVPLIGWIVMLVFLVQASRPDNMVCAHSDSSFLLYQWYDGGPSRKSVVVASGWVLGNRDHIIDSCRFTVCSTDDITVQEPAKPLYLFIERSVFWLDTG